MDFFSPRGFDKFLHGLSYAELPSMIPKTVAEYSYAREAFEGDLAPFLIGWIIIFTEVVCALLLQG